MKENSHDVEVVNRFPDRSHPIGKYGRMHLDYLQKCHPVSAIDPSGHAESVSVRGRRQGSEDDGQPDPRYDPAGRHHRTDEVR